MWDTRATEAMTALFSERLSALQTIENFIGERGRQCAHCEHGSVVRSRKTGRNGIVIDQGEVLRAGAKPRDLKCFGTRFLFTKQTSSHGHKSFPSSNIYLGEFPSCWRQDCLHSRSDQRASSIASIHNCQRSPDAYAIFFRERPQEQRHGHTDTASQAFRSDQRLRRCRHNQDSTGPLLRRTMTTGLPVSGTTSQR